MRPAPSPSLATSTFGLQSGQLPSSRLQAEIKQNKPFESPQQEAYLSLLRTTDQLHRDAERLMGEHGITQQQYNVLRILRGAGPGGLPTLAIAERLIQQTPGITRLLDRLEAKNLITRGRSATDRREVVCGITSAGEELLDSLAPQVQAATNAVFRGLTTAETQTLVEILEKIRIPE
jgi:DNA-binding MarR family transcriptional regulator